MKKGSLMVALWLACGMVAVAGEKPVSLDDVPAAARAAIEAFAAGGEIEKVAQGEEDGQAVYEAEIETEAGEREICVSATGEVLETAVEVKLEDVPEAVRAAIASRQGAGKIDEIVREQEGGRVTYEVELETADGEVEIEIAEDGTVLDDDSADDDDDDDDDDEGDDD